MKQFFLLLIFLVCISCSGEKELQLSEIMHSKIFDIKDVSPAYLFYDLEAEDSISLNKQNLISTTNWLVNVDKRLTLKQAIPVLIGLQNKKRDASHKNKDAKNYFTAFNPEKKTLCFIEFTNVIYHADTSVNQYIKAGNITPDIVTVGVEGIRFQDTTYSAEKFISLLNSTPDKDYKFILNLDKQLPFQEYMHIKDLLLTVTNSSILINTNEFIF
ncbi:hypothetical protein [Formosa haliotis]|uniref:hypothetical protein n=1 Tax=Formosa haliotis TaxID=1555194 RepID=UPI0008247541|nr:hypothetical protein [Formosa haliotis]